MFTLNIKNVVLGTCLLLTNSIAHAVIIGSWDIQSAPTSASALSGTASGLYNQWLNVTNAAISANEALSGDDILADGIANLTPDALYELNYASGSAVNITGTDLVLFDAHYDSGSYAVSTSFDGFATELTLSSSAFVSTGESRDYYFGGLAGIYPASIWGAAIDLSLLGVTDGAEVTSIRVRSLSADAADFIGVGSLSSGISVPEPNTIALFGLGLAGLGFARRKKAV